MKRTSILLRFALGALVAGCMLPSVFAAPDAPPAVTLQNVKIRDARARIIAANTADGFKLIGAVPQLLVFSKLYPSSAPYHQGAKPQLITRYTITNAGAVTRISGVIGTKMVLEGRGESAVIDLTEGIGKPELTSILRRIKNSADSSEKRPNS